MPDSPSLVLTTKPVGFCGSCGSKTSDGGASSMWTDMELVAGVVLALGVHGVVPRGAGHSVDAVAVDRQAGCWVGLGASMVRGAVHSADLGGACGGAGVHGYGVVDPDAGVGVVRAAERNGDWIVVHRDCLVAAVPYPRGVDGAQVDLEASVVGTWERVSTLNDQLTGLGHCCHTVLSLGSAGPFSCGSRTRPKGRSRRRHWRKASQAKDHPTDSRRTIRFPKVRPVR